jgi:enolase
MSEIKRLSALEILDSRGRPTVSATCELASGVLASASVPSGASTGSAEAHELRDGDSRRYAGLGCRRAVENIRGEMQRSLGGREFAFQRELDQALLTLDGTSAKSRLGANAILAVSMAFARAQAADQEIPLYEHFARMAGESLQSLPRPTINLFSGGKHAGGQVDIQDVLIVPTAAATIDECLVAASAVYRAAVELINRNYGMRWLTADEGGLAPPAESIEELLDDAIDAIVAAGLEPGNEICLALDVAASHFYEGGSYHLQTRQLTSRQMIDEVAGWVQRYPIISVEDALAEDDWENWPLLASTIGKEALVLGDDLLCTNPARIVQARNADACNALLLKVNQVGTISEALDALRSARSAQWQVTMSARSGETEDDWLSDLAVGWGGDQLKIGSLTQSERLAKYNRLLAIEHDLQLPVKAWPRPGQQRSSYLEDGPTRWQH